MFIFDCSDAKSIQLNIVQSDNCDDDLDQSTLFSPVFQCYGSFTGSCSIYSFCDIFIMLCRFTLCFPLAKLNVRELLRRLRIEMYLKDARANRKETHVW